MLAKTIMQVSPCLLVPFLALGCKWDLRTGWNAKSDAGSATANGDAGFTRCRSEGSFMIPLRVAAAVVAFAGAAAAVRALNWNVEEGRRPSISASTATVVATARRELSRMEVKT